ncbi:MULTISPECIES: polysaccharide biosynthesis/export family protein [unclassified Methylobacterium]|uniref:polysaccharide biosynthesis/export family protein n=1 Tax=unclassified Methylobacterium TaxID=2615210 RepID=UPI0009E70476|nr:MULTISPECIES: polysaccharide biosynthesis/export family protein [unclassified Methylobacterium]
MSMRWALKAANFRAALAGPIIAIGTLGGTSTAFADYRIAAGDVLELNVYGISLQRRETVDPDGNISMPLIGQTHAEGLTLVELLDRLRSLISAKSYNQRLPDGREAVTVIAPDEVSISIVEYRPVYLKGDVAQPSEQAFRPGMTVRQAVARSGGYDIVRSRIESSPLSSLDSLDEYRKLWLDRVRLGGRIDFYRDALGRPREAEPIPVGRNPLVEAVEKGIRKSEIDRLAAKQAGYREVYKGFEKNIANAIERMRVLENQIKSEEDGSKSDAEDAERIAELYRRGSVPLTRVSDARRLALLSASRMLQVSANIEVAKKERVTAETDLQRTKNDHLAEMMTDLSDTSSDLRKTNSRIDAVWDKISYITALRSQLAGGGGSPQSITIFRKVGASTFPQRANEDTPLEPGDVIEVRLQVDSAKLFSGPSTASN